MFRWMIWLGKMEVGEGEDFAMSCWKIRKGNEFMVLVEVFYWSFLKMECLLCLFLGKLLSYFRWWEFVNGIA
ncbi:hypothetical protein, partial [Bacillus pumilus]|uniref:hypothetical protein n=1 Tax=Bacillus pumilus TaxID=1408 RepID=UPI001C92E352